MCLMRKRFAFWHSRSYNWLKTIEVYIEVGIKEVGQKSGEWKFVKMTQKWQSDWDFKTENK